jgi:methionine-rich copper-binding protein CopC
MIAWLMTGTLVVAPTAAWSHAALVRSNPARRAVLTQPPERVQLWFNEPVEPRFSTVSVSDAAGTRVDLQNAAVDPDDPKRLSVGLAGLGQAATPCGSACSPSTGTWSKANFPSRSGGRHDAASTRAGTAPRSTSPTEAPHGSADASAGPGA